MTRALISVSDKEGIVELARALTESGVEVISTGGTFRTLVQAGLPVTEVADITGFPEMMDGRVKTLHPLIHGGLLALRDHPSHMQSAQEHGIEMIDYVVVNLYPFAQTIEKPDVALADAVENIDIGGPSMLRAAAKNYRFVTTIVDPADYGFVADRVRAGQVTTEEERFRLAAKVFRHTAAYDARIAEYLTAQTDTVFPESYTMTFDRVQSLRYGENPHQRAAFYRMSKRESPSLVDAQQLQGKELSYNNIQDAGAAIDLLMEFVVPTAIAVKHMNPCGVGSAASIGDALELAYAADPVSIFGGIVAVNRELNDRMAERLASLFLEIIIAPSYTAGAREILSKKKNVRVLQLDLLASTARQMVFKSVPGGLLVQDADIHVLSAEDLQVVTDRAPTEQEIQDLLFAWKVVKHVKSNAIVLVAGQKTVGIGAGQMNRVGSALIAVNQAGDIVRGSVMASDAFFPMSDTLEVAAEAGVTAIIQPGGSIRDKDSIEAANRYGIAMVFTGVRHFRHG